MTRFVPTLGLVALSLAGCGSTEPGTDAGSITDVERSSALNAIELMRGNYGLRVIGNGLSARVVISRTGTEPLILLNGTRSSILELTQIAAADVTGIEVLTAMADTMVYGQEAAMNGVIRVTVGPLE